MADKTVTVRLKAVVDDYQAAMKKAADATDGVAKAGSKLSALAPNLKKLGDQLSIGVTLPMVAAGAGALKMSNDFDLTFSRMVGLAGVSADAVGGLKDQVLQLAGQTARAPQDLAEGLYFIESAGLSGATAMDALKVSAKAASAGLGDTATVADAVTSAINAYGASNITAARAGDVLAATVKDGKAEASALAPQFGRLLPIAAQLGITFDQVGAGMAFLSRSSGDAALSATQMSGVMSALLRPTQQSAQALSDVGMSFAGIQLEIKQKGLLATLTDLRARLGDSGFVKFFQDVQGLQGALQLTGANAKDAKQVFDDLANSTGALDNAFGAFADSAGFKQKQAFAEIQVDLIKVGDILAPLVAQLAGFASSFADMFAGLPTPVLDLAVAFAGLLAAVGPIMTVTARLKMLQATLAGMGRGGELAAGGLGMLAKAAVVLPVVAGGLHMIGEAVNPSFHADMGRLNDQLVAFVHGAGATGDLAELLGGHFDHLKTSLADNGDTAKQVGEKMITLGGILGDTNPEKATDQLKQLDEALTQLAHTDPAAARQAFDQISAGLKANGGDVDQLIASLPGYTSAMAAAAVAQGDSATSGDENAAALAEQQAAADKAAKSIQALADQLHAAMDPLFGMLDAVRNNAQANDDAAVALRDHGAASQEYADAADKATKSALDVQSAAIALAGAISQGTVSVDTAISTLQSWVDQGLITQQSADVTAQKFRDAGDEAAALQGTNVRMAVTVDTSSLTAAEQEINRLRSYLGQSMTMAAAMYASNHRWGGVDYAFAGGGMLGAHVAAGTMVKYAEPATGGEAYIPRLGDTNRSLGILQTAAGWYGQRIVPDAAMGSAQRAGGGVSIVDQRSISIAISPGVFNKSEVYDQVVQAVYGFHNQHGWDGLERQLASVRRG